MFGDPRSRTDGHARYADAAYAGPFGGDVDGRRPAAVDYYVYTGAYPFDSGADGIVVSNDRVTLDADLRRADAEPARSRSHHLDVRHAKCAVQLHNHQKTSDTYGTQLDENHPSTVFGLYAQDEVTLRPWLLLNAGVRLDHQDAFGSSLTPRAGLVFLPRRQSAVKLLYGRAFRAPNLYELHYYAAMEDFGLTLEPETDRHHRGRLGGVHRRPPAGGGVGLPLRRRSLITQRTLGIQDPPDGGLYFANDGSSRAPWRGR